MTKLKTCDICFEKVSKVLRCFKTENCKAKVCKVCISKSLEIDYEGIIKYKCPFCRQFRKNIPGSSFHKFCTLIPEPIFKLYEKEVKKFYSIEFSCDEDYPLTSESESVDEEEV